MNAGRKRARPIPLPGETNDRTCSIFTRSADRLHGTDHSGTVIPEFHNPRPRKFISRPMPFVSRSRKGRLLQWMRIYFVRFIGRLKGCRYEPFGWRAWALFLFVNVTCVVFCLISTTYSIIRHFAIGLLFQIIFTLRSLGFYTVVGNLKI